MLQVVDLMEKEIFFVAVMSNGGATLSPQRGMKMAQLPRRSSGLPRAIPLDRSRHLNSGGGAGAVAPLSLFSTSY